MPRNLDLTALRSFVTVADTGGVTRASGFLNLTQSAVSMQIKRLEDALDLRLLDRSARSVTLTAAGEQLVSYARRMLELNDEALTRLTCQEYEGEIVLGVPHDIVYPAIPQVLCRFHSKFPRVKLQLVSSYTARLKTMFKAGECHMILTTETNCDPGGEELIERRLTWVGALGGSAWRRRPLRLAFEHNCFFRPGVQAALDAAGIDWEMAVESDSSQTIEASVSADLAVHAVIEGTEPAMVERIAHGGGLPELQEYKINLYFNDAVAPKVIHEIAEEVRTAYCCLGVNSGKPVVSLAS